MYPHAFKIFSSPSFYNLPLHAKHKTSTQWFCGFYSISFPKQFPSHMLSKYFSSSFISEVGWVTLSLKLEMQKYKHLSLISVLKCGLHISLLNVQHPERLRSHTVSGGCIQMAFSHASVPLRGVAACAGAHVVRGGEKQKSCRV